jgi:hypothetical protein
MTGAVVVDNETGAPLKVTGCGPTPTFAVVLGNNAIPPSAVWPARACPLTHVTVPDGRSAYPVTVQAAYQGCDPNHDWGPNRLPVPCWRRNAATPAPLFHRVQSGRTFAR